VVGMLGVAAVGRAAEEEKGPGLRVISYNIHKCTGWPVDRRRARRAVKLGQMPRRMADELALYDPQIVTFSESPDEGVTREIAELLSMRHVRFPSGKHWPGTLLTRFEVVESQNAPVPGGERPADLFTRHWGRAVLKRPTGDHLVVHSAHLHPSDADVRRREIDVMVEVIRGDLKTGQSVLLVGDLNHRPMPPEYPRWQELGLVDTFAAAGNSAGEQDEGLTIPADKPRARIDFVWAGGPLASQVRAARPLFEGAFRVNVEDSESFALSDHLPIMADFGG
jgi:endonuclease/exonuclease/phosphatase family metal-dependent hydrolase